MRVLLKKSENWITKIVRMPHSWLLAFVNTLPVCLKSCCSRLDIAKAQCIVFV
jgi:hypothetical protein